MQLNFDLYANSAPPAAALAAVELLASQGGGEARGAVFTRREVVDLIFGDGPRIPVKIKGASPRSSD